MFFVTFTLWALQEETGKGPQACSCWEPVLTKA